MTARDRQDSAGPHRLVNVSEHGNVVVIELLRSQLLRSAGIEQLESELQGLAEGYPGQTIVLDFNVVEAISSEMIGALIVLQKLVAAQRGRLRLCGLRDSVRQTMALSRVDTAFAIFPDAAAALSES